MMPLPDTLTGKWRCVCPKLHWWTMDLDALPCVPRTHTIVGSGDGPCSEEPIVLVRDEQSGSLDDREGQEFG